MKAAFFTAFGGPDVLRYGDVPDPVARPGEILVAVRAASVNGADWKMRAGLREPLHPPHILGRDFSGVVLDAGADGGDLKAGDAVFGVCAAGQEGAYAEKIAVRAELVAKKPANISHPEAAALGVSALTALSAIEETLRVGRGEKVLILGGAGGVGGVAVQLAKHFGAHVTATASASNLEYLRELGADEAIDYNAGDFTQQVRDCDAVFDTVGGQDDRAFAVVRPDGRAAFIASGLQPPASQRADVTSLRPPVTRARQHVQRIAHLAEIGAIRAPHISLFSLAEAAAAHRVSESRHFRGKLVFKID